MAKGDVKCCELGKRRKGLVLCLASVGAFVVNFVCMITVISHDKSGDVSSNPEPCLCVRCDELTQNGSIPATDQLRAKLIKSQDSGQCCVENLEQTSTLLEQLLRPPEHEKEPLPVFDPTNFTLSKASLHKRLLPKEWYERYKVKFFGHDLELGFRQVITDNAQHERSVKTDTDGVTIILPGQYLVYSSTHFLPETGTRCKDFGEQTWTHRVVKKREDEPGLSETLISVSYTCEDESTRIHETKYTAGVFDLKADDQLRMYISGKGLLSYQVESTFMGLVMLGENDPLAFNSRLKSQPPD